MTQTLASDGVDGTGDRDDRKFALGQLTTSGNKPSPRQLPSGIPLSLSKPPPEYGDDYRLNRSDFIRQQLRKPEFPLNEIPTLESLIDDLLDEGPSLEFEVIAQARLDKIVEEMLHHVKDNFLSQGPSFRQVMRKVSKLREQWIRNFGERYHTMDDERLNFMLEVGCLRDLELQPTGEVSKVDGPKWRIKRADTFSEKEANENFKLGA
ncbi:hypothetical protein NHQ30_004813 [Ciborinia camelliae]|nr:hypothetical protein NHQ30_004813 [Ciborinia camelliae]